VENTLKNEELGEMTTLPWCEV